MVDGVQMNGGWCTDGTCSVQQKRRLSTRLLLYCTVGSASGYIAYCLSMSYNT